MENYKFIMDLALILLSTKVLGVLTTKLKLPQVVGALIAGIILGPAVLGWVEETPYLQATSEIGVIILMFCAGMETDIDELKKSGKSAFIIALCGVLVPLVGGYLVAVYFNRPGLMESDASGSLFLQNLFVGIILTATSVSITVETLKEMGKLKTQSGNAILGAAIIDDVLGIVALTIATSMAGGEANIGVVLLKIAAFFVFVLVVGYFFCRFYENWALENHGLHRHSTLAFVLCLALAYIGEQFFGVADITGAFFAGLIISRTQKTAMLASRFDVLSYLYLSPIFFASIGLKVVLPEMNGTIVAFAVALTLVAVVTKIVGCGLGAKMCGYVNNHCVRIGVGMISRGEVALIVASKGEELGILGSSFIGPIVIVVVITTVVTPILLKVAYSYGTTVPTPESTLSSRYEQVRSLREGNIGNISYSKRLNAYVADKKEKRGLLHRKKRVCRTGE